MGWLTYRLGYGKYGTVDGDTPDSPPQVTIAGQPVQVVVTAATPITNNDLVAIPSSTNPVRLLQENLSRKAFAVYNNSSANLFIRFGSDVSPIFFNARIPRNAYYETDFYAWAGEVWGIWDSENGNALVSQLY